MVEIKTSFRSRRGLGHHVEIIGLITKTLAVLSVWLLGASIAHADERVRLLQTPDLRPGLCTALRIQLADVSEVVCEADARSGEALSERIAWAAKEALEQGDRLVVLLEPDPNPRRVRMYLIAGRTDRALVAIEQIENRPEPDVDRSLALKVRDSVDAVLRYEVVAGTSTEPELAVAIAEAPKPPEVNAPTGLWKLVLEAGGALVLGPQTRGAANVALGAERDRGRSYADLLLGARFLSVAEERDPIGKVETREWGLGLSLRAGIVLESARLGLSFDPQLTFVDATGTTQSGASGTRGVSSFSSVIALDLRLRLAKYAWLRAAPAIEVFAVAQRFSLDDQVTFELGRTRVWLPLSLLFELPLGNPS